eukprot:scaffold27428_cov21-Tisochrysis_lutea.AAC.1
MLTRSNGHIKWPPFRCTLLAQADHLLKVSVMPLKAQGGVRDAKCQQVPLPSAASAPQQAIGTKDSRTPPEGMQRLTALLQAAARLDAAQRKHGPPTMRNAAMQ